MTTSDPVGSNRLIRVAALPLGRRSEPAAAAFGGLLPRALLPLALSLCIFLTNTARADLDFQPTWQPPDYHQVRQQVRDWLEGSSADADDQQRVLLQWPAEDAGGEILDRAILSAAAIDDRVAQLIEHCRTLTGLRESPKVDWLEGADVSPWLRANVLLYLARQQTHAQLYDEASRSLASLSLSEVVDPAALLFYRMAAYHQIVQPDKARAALVQLLEHEQTIPHRFAKLARLVERDLANLDDESLDHISRRMDDIRRRLAIGRAGERVQQIERDVVKSLEKLIEEEQQRQQQQQSQGGGSSQSSRPMEDSRPAELKAPGRVDPKDIGNRSGWGDLPPKEREQALEQLGREFPVHYRELIEQYFRDLADQSETNNR